MDFDQQEIEVRNLGGPGLALTLEEMLLDLRADSADENQTVERLIRGCTDYFEIRTGYRLSPANYSAAFSCLSPSMLVQRGPVRQVDGIQFYNTTTKAWEAIDPANYAVEDDGGRAFRIGFDLATIGDLWAGSPPPQPTRRYPLRMTFSAGYDRADETGSEVNGFAPDGMITALKGLVALEFQNREAGSNIDGEKDIVLRAYRWFW